jgi:hypothetical protein
MQPVSFEYFHGTPGDNVLKILDSGVLKPGRNGSIFLGRYSWESCMRHGADTRRRESYVIRIRIGELSDATRIFRETHSVRDAVEIQTDQPVRVEVLELYVRRLRKDEAASLDRLAGVTAIKQYLAPMYEG